PCAAGARPSTRTLGWVSPHPAIGRPQYGSEAYAARRAVATSSRQATSRGQARHTDTAAVSVSRSADPAMRRTPAAVTATGVSGLAGSPGQPLPGGTGDGNP